MERKVRIGDFGKALAKASKEHRSVYWLKNQLDVLYSKLREQQRVKRNRDDKSKPNS